ncbi:tape measure protein, partial [Escherichia coli]|nr:tape measure protein [Escherichia coli]EEY1503495.1 tape measure protein [Escherichia coli]
RIIRALAAGMGVARKDLKAMADDGKLTADKVVPALISQLGVLRDEYAAMPETVSDGITKVENAFMAWVGGANEASGATKTLSGVLNGVAGNIDNVATAAGALVAVGVARYFGNMAAGVGKATTELIAAKSGTVALAAAQADAAVQVQRKAAADALAAERAWQLAQAELALARNSSAEALATQNAVAKRRAMIVANAALVQSNQAVAASRKALENATSVTGMLKSGAASLLSLVGGIPGLLMLGAGAWYTVYQNQEQARESARQYASTIDEIRAKVPGMTLPELADNEGKTREALEEQNRLIAEQESKVRGLKTQIADYQRWLQENPQGGSGVEIITHGLAEATGKLAVEQSRLTQMQEKAKSVQEALASLEYNRVARIREEAAEQNRAYQALLQMNVQHTEFNRLLGLGNELLQQRQGLVNVPLRLPQAT